MRLRHIEVFNALMLTGSVSGAARLVHVTQPAVSKVLAHAETQLGFALFHRHRNRLVPTAEAQALWPHVEQVFSALDTVQRLSANLKAGREAGTLRVAAILTLGHEVLPRALQRFTRRHPDVAVTVTTLHSAQMLPGLLLGEADIGLLYSPAAHPALALETLGQTHMVAAAPRGLLPAAAVRRGHITLRELSRCRVIGLDGSQPLGITVAQACREAEVGLHGTLTVQTYQAALSLARHGLGVALIDGCTALSAQGGGLDVLTLEPRIAVPIQAARLATRPGSVIAQAFTDAVRQVLEQAFGAPGEPSPALMEAAAAGMLPAADQL